MPYISEFDRKKFDEILNKLPDIEKKGELEYCIFKLMVKYMDLKTFNYTNLHDTVYAAIHCGDEYRRRFLDQRENNARLENGDVE